MSNRKEYMKKWREEHKEHIKQYKKEYAKNHDSSFKKLQQKNGELKKQLEYLRSGEYYNQLRFENEMLQQVVDTKGVPSEVYDYIDCTHRNTELLKENQELKEDISFCLHSIKQEMEMSTDSRTRSEMTSCYEILRKWNE